MIQLLIYLFYIELAKYGSLYHYLRDRELSFDKIVKWALHIARGFF